MYFTVFCLTMSMRESEIEKGKGKSMRGNTGNGATPGPPRRCSPPTPLHPLSLLPSFYDMLVPTVSLAREPSSVPVYSITHGRRRLFLSFSCILQREEENVWR